MNFNQVLKDIKSLKIQGAGNVARAGVKSLKLYSSKAKTKKAFLKDLEKVRKKIFITRPTEPAMHNFVRYVLARVREGPDDVKELRKILNKSIDDVLIKANESRKELAKVGASRIPKKGVVMTHCHSSTVRDILVEAKRQGKKFSVICTETRPRFQGRLTAKDLLKAKIPTKMVVDSGIFQAVKKADIILIGADSILSEGSCINKIGSEMLAFLANELNTPLFVCSTTWKFDPESKKEGFTKIEQRDPKEVWKNPPKKLKISNPAFDLVDRQLIDGIITEKGVVAPENMFNLFKL